MLGRSTTTHFVLSAAAALALFICALPQVECQGKNLVYNTYFCFQKKSFYFSEISHFLNLLSKIL